MREHQLGGPRRMEVAAALTSAATVLLFGAALFVASILFGPAAGTAPAERLLGWID